MDNELYQVRPEVWAMLEGLAKPGHTQAILGRISAEMGVSADRLQGILNALIASGALERAESAGQPAAYTLDYAKIGVHKRMLRDHARTDAFRRALEEVVRPGSTVIDVGAGTGILSLFAARANAQRVYALEHTRIVELAREIATVNGFQDRIEFVRGDAKSFDGHIGADVIVSEWIGNFLIKEHAMYHAFTVVRDRHLKAGGVVVPRSGDLFLIAVDSSALHDKWGSGFWDRPVYGFDYSPVGRFQTRSMYQPVASVVPAEDSVSTPWKIASYDFLRDNVDAFSFDRIGEVEVERAARVSGFCGYFSLQLSPGVLLDTSPNAQPTHWEQVYFPTEPFLVERGDRLRLRLMIGLGAASSECQLEVTQVRGSSDLLTFHRAYAIDG